MIRESVGNFVSISEMTSHSERPSGGRSLNVGMEELVEGAGAVLVFEGEDCLFCRLATLTESAGGELGLSARGLFGV